VADPQLLASRLPTNTLAARVRAQLPLKVAVCLGLAVGICVPYFLLQNHSVLPPRTVPLTALDGWIGFGPDWVWAYESIAVLVPTSLAGRVTRFAACCTPTAMRGLQTTYSNGAIACRWRHRSS
jgi:hypothetical protein